MLRPADQADNALHALTEPLSSRRNGTTAHPTPPATPADNPSHIGNGLAKEESDLIRMMLQLDASQRTALLNLLKLNISAQKNAL